MLRKLHSHMILKCPSTFYVCEEGNIWFLRFCLWVHIWRGRVRV